MKARNARFWVFVNGGAAKLTLRPGQTLRHGTGGPTDEGWSWGETSWTHAGDEVRREWVEDGRDCDGRQTQTGTDYCPISRLRSGPFPFLSDQDRASPLCGPYWHEVVWPSWRGSDRSIYDEFAVLAGY